MPLPARRVTLSPGWNLVSWSGPISTAAGAIKPIQSALSAGYRWDPITDTLQPFLLATGAALPVSIRPDDSLWILVRGATTFLWDQPGL